MVKQTLLSNILLACVKIDQQLGICIKKTIIREENMTSVRQIIDLTQDDDIVSTQDDDIDDYGTLADDAFLTIEIPMSQ